MLYTIYHPTGGGLNLNCSEDIKFVLVATVEAKSLNHAFVRSQNDWNEEYAALGFRSTSVGDIIRGKTVNMVMGVGFKKLEDGVCEDAETATS